MNCDKCRENLEDHLRGELAQEARAEMKKHIASCPECARELASLRAYFKEMGSLERTGAPADFLERLSLRLSADRQTQGRGQQPFAWLFSPAGAKVAATAALALLMTLMWHRFTGTPGMEKPGELLERKVAEKRSEAQDEKAPAVAYTGRKAEVRQEEAPAAAYAEDMAEAREEKAVAKAPQGKARQRGVAKVMKDKDAVEQIQLSMVVARVGIGAAAAPPAARRQTGGGAEDAEAESSFELSAEEAVVAGLADKTAAKKKEQPRRKAARAPVSRQNEAETAEGGLERDLADLARSLGGRVTASTLDGTGRLSAASVEIAAARYDEFYDGLGALGLSRLGPPVVPASQHGTLIVHLSINRQ